MVNIILFSDIHGNVEALKAILEDIKLQQYDEIFFLGDAIGIGPSSKECIDILKETNIKCILGNHELYLLNPSSVEPTTHKDVLLHHEWISELFDNKDKEFIRSWNKYLDIELAGKKMRFAHFVFKKDSNEFYSTKVIDAEDVINAIFEDDIDLYFIGHKHTPSVIKKYDKQIIDIGSSGCVNDNMTFYTILTITNSSIEIYKKYVEFDREKLVQKILKKEYPARTYFSKHYFNLNVNE